MLYGSKMIPASEKGRFFAFGVRRLNCAGGTASWGTGGSRTAPIVKTHTARGGRDYESGCRAGGLAAWRRTASTLGSCSPCTCACRYYAWSCVLIALERAPLDRVVATPPCLIVVIHAQG